MDILKKNVKLIQNHETKSYKSIPEYITTSLSYWKSLEAAFWARKT